VQELLLPEQEPLQPEKPSPWSGLAVRVTVDPPTKPAEHVVPPLPQVIPPGVLVTVPVPVPAVATDRFRNGLKVAVTDWLSFMVRVQPPLPEQAPLQPRNPNPWSGVAVRLTEASIENAVEHVLPPLPHVIPAGVLLTVPVPLPAVATFSWGCEKLAETCWSEVIFKAQEPVPEHASPHPRNFSVGFGVAVKVTLVPAAKLAEHVLPPVPQLMPAGLVVMVPALMYAPLKYVRTLFTVTVNGPDDEPAVNAVNCGLHNPSSVRFITALRVPEAEGVRVTSISQEAPLATLLPHVLFEIAKSPAFAPVIKALLMFNAFAPSALKTLMASAGLVVLTGTSPKLRLCGDTTALVLQAERLTTWGLRKPPLEAPIWSDPADGPVPPFQSTPRVQLLPEGMLAGQVLLLTVNGPVLEIETVSAALSLLVKVTVCVGGPNPTCTVGKVTLSGEDDTGGTEEPDRPTIWV
jgi:hypothetical protein